MQNHASRATSVDHGPNGESLTYCELEARTNRLAHLLPARGLCRLDRYAIFTENNAHYIDCGGAGELRRSPTPLHRCPNDDFGEEVKAVVQLIPGGDDARLMPQGAAPGGASVS